MSITDVGSDVDVSAGLDDPSDDTEAESSALVTAISGLAGLVLGSTIVYVAFPYCVSC